MWIYRFDGLKWRGYWPNKGHPYNFAYNFCLDDHWEIGCGDILGWLKSQISWNENER
jgi:hypothetical protein